MDESIKKYTCQECKQDVSVDDIEWGGIDINYPNRNTMKLSQTGKHKICGGIVIKKEK